MRQTDFSSEPEFPASSIIFSSPNRIVGVTWNVNACARTCPLTLKGIHHLTAVSSDIRENHRFYTRVLGMRLVKRIVNQDDVSAHHLFSADAVGSPGTDVTFFDWTMPRKKRGTHSITRTALRVNGGAALAWWEAHLKEQGVTVNARGVHHLAFRTPDEE